MGSRNIRSVITQISLDHNARVAKALRNLATNISTDLAATGVKPVVLPMDHKDGGLGIRLTHGVRAVSDSSTSQRVAEAHRTLAQKLSSKSEVTKMMGM